MSKVESLKLLINTPISRTKFVQRPTFDFIRDNELKNLKYARDELCLSTQKRSISLSKVKKLFPTGKLERYNLIKAGRYYKGEPLPHEEYASVLRALGLDPEKYYVKD